MVDYKEDDMNIIEENIENFKKEIEFEKSAEEIVIFNY
jgi:hypothetical protein